MAFPARDQAEEVVQLGEKPLDLPTPFVPAQRPSVLSFAPFPPVRRDQLDAVLGGELIVERVRVVCFVPDKPGRELVEEASGKNLLHKQTLGRALRSGQIRR